MRECIQISKTSCTFTMFLLTATLRWSPLVNDHVHNHEHLPATIAAALKTFNFPGSRVLLAPTEALYTTPIKKIHLTSSFSSKSHFDLLTLLKNYTQPTPLNHWGWWCDDTAADADFNGADANATTHIRVQPCLLDLLMQFQTLSEGAPYVMMRYIRPS